MKDAAEEKSASSFEDVTFITAIRIESAERINNINFCVHYILKRLKAHKHIVIEQDLFTNIPEVVKTKDYFYFRDSNDYGFFYRTKLLNSAIEFVDTPYLCIFDSDVYVPEGALIACMNQLRKFENINFIIPYTGVVFEIPNAYSLNYNLTIDKINPKELRKIHDNSKSGILLARTDRIKEIHGYNENIKSWGFDNDEFFTRAAIMGYPVIRPKSYFCLYHFEHTRGKNSSSINPFYRANSEEFDKIQKMNKKQIINHKYF
jgi:hypothetical protein